MAGRSKKLKKGSGSGLPTTPLNIYSSNPNFASFSASNTNRADPFLRTRAAKALKDLGEILGAQEDRILGASHLEGRSRAAKSDLVATQGPTAPLAPGFAPQGGQD